MKRLLTLLLSCSILAGAAGVIGCEYEEPYEEERVPAPAAPIED